VDKTHHLTGKKKEVPATGIDTPGGMSHGAKRVKNSPEKNRSDGVRAPENGGVKFSQQDNCKKTGLSDANSSELQEKT